MESKHIRIVQKKVNRMKRLFFVLLLLLCYTARAEYSDHRNRKVDSLENVLQSGQRMSDEQLIRLHSDLMWGYLQTDGLRAETNARKVLALSYEHDWLNSRVDALRLLGLLAYGDERYDESIAYYEWALAVTDSMQTSGKYKEADIDDNLSSLYGTIGNLYNIQDKNLLAIECYQKAMPIFEKYGWRESLTILHHNMAELYLVIGNNEEAERHYRSAIEHGRATGDSLMMALPHKGLAKIYIDRDDYQQAQQTIEPAYAYYTAHRDEEPGDYAEVLASLAKINLMSGHENLTQAKVYALEALNVVNDEMMTETRCNVFAAAAMVEMKAGGGFALYQQGAHHDGAFFDAKLSEQHFADGSALQYGEEAKAYRGIEPRETMASVGRCFAFSLAYDLGSSFLPVVARCQASTPYGPLQGAFRGRGG